MKGSVKAMEDVLAVEVDDGQDLIELIEEAE